MLSQARPEQKAGQFGGAQVTPAEKHPGKRGTTLGGNAEGGSEGPAS